MVKIIIIAGALLMAAPIWAMRCGGQLIMEGDSVSKVVRYCGTPTWQQNPIAYGDASIWQYSMDDGMTYTLLLKQGVVYSVQFSRS